MIKKTTKKKTTLNDMLDIIQKWQKDNDVIFFGDFISFDKNGTVIDDQSRIFCYGDKEMIRIAIEDFYRIITKETEKFINW